MSADGTTYEIGNPLDPYWPVTDVELDTYAAVANAALKEVGLAYSIRVDEDGFAYTTPPVADEDYPLVEKALDIGWRSAAMVAPLARIAG